MRRRRCLGRYARCEIASRMIRRGGTGLREQRCDPRIGVTSDARTQLGAKKPFLPWEGRAGMLEALMKTEALHRIDRVDLQASIARRAPRCPVRSISGVRDLARAASDTRVEVTRTLGAGSNG